MRKLTLLITQILQSDIFIGIVGKDLILFSIHTCRLAVMLNVGYLQGFGWAPTPFKDVGTAAKARLACMFPLRDSVIPRLSFSLDTSNCNDKTNRDKIVVPKKKVCAMLIGCHR